MFVLFRYVALLRKWATEDVHGKLGEFSCRRGGATNGEREMAFETVEAREAGDVEKSARRRSEEVVALAR